MGDTDIIPARNRVSHIVADMAPDASLELYTVTNNIGIDEAISHIISRGEADVLTISLGVPGLGGDGSTKYYRDGTSNVAQAVDRARESGILVTVSAGNKAQKHWGGTYVPSSTVTPELIDGLDSYQSILEVDPSASGLQKACLPLLLVLIISFLHGMRGIKIPYLMTMIFFSLIMTCRNCMVILQNGSSLMDNPWKR